MGWACPSCGWSPRVINGFPQFLTQEQEMSGESHFPKEDHAILASVESRSFWFRNRNTLILQVLEQYFPQAGRFLEIGCGTGFVLGGLVAAKPTISIVGADLYWEGLIHARQRIPSADLLQLDGRNIPFRDEFDVVGIFDVLEHLEEDGAILQEIYRTLKNKGGVIITVPQHIWLWSRRDVQACHLRRYKRKKLHEIIHSAGFRIAYTTSFISLLLPALFISRVSMKRSLGGCNDLTLPPRIDNLMEKLCLIEHILIRRRVSLPFGGSLLCVAYKE